MLSSSAFIMGNNLIKTLTKKCTPKVSKGKRAATRQWRMQQPRTHQSKRAAFRRDD